MQLKNKVSDFMIPNPNLIDFFSHSLFLKKEITKERKIFPKKLAFILIIPSVNASIDNVAVYNTSLSLQHPAS